MILHANYNRCMAAGYRPRHNYYSTGFPEDTTTNHYWTEPGFDSPGLPKQNSSEMTHHYEKCWTYSIQLELHNNCSIPLKNNWNTSSRYNYYNHNKLLRASYNRCNHPGHLPRRSCYNMGFPEGTTMNRYCFEPVPGSFGHPKQHSNGRRHHAPKYWKYSSHVAFRNSYYIRWKRNTDSSRRYNNRQSSWPSPCIDNWYRGSGHKR